MQLSLRDITLQGQARAPVDPLSGYYYKRYSYCLSKQEVHCPFLEKCISLCKKWGNLWHSGHSLHQLPFSSIPCPRITVLKMSLIAAQLRVRQQGSPPHSSKSRPMALQEEKTPAFLLSSSLLPSVLHCTSYIVSHGEYKMPPEQLARGILASFLPSHHHS